MDVYRNVANRVVTYAQTITPRRGAIIGLLVLGCFPAACAWQAIASNRIPLPHWDEWFTPGSLLYEWCNGTLTFRDFSIPHNESRKFFPRILYWVLAQVHGWDVRDAMTLVFVELCTLSLLLLKLLRETRGASAVAAATTWAVMTFLCFSPVQFENLLWGIQLETFFPGVAVVAVALINLSKLSLPARTVSNALLAFVATYTYANGMLLWVLAVPLRDAGASRRSTMVCYAAYLVIAASSVTAYFHGYERPADLPVVAFAGRDPIDLAHYAVLWVGAYFQSELVSAFAAGTCAIVFGALAFLAAAMTVARSRDWRPFYPWFLIGTYSAASCAIIAIGRLPLGLEHATDSRYTAFSLFFYLAMSGCCFALYATAVRKPSTVRDLFLKASAIAIGVASAAWVACYHAGVKHLELRRTQRVALSHALEWMNVIPDNPDIRAIFPHPQWLFDSIPVLRQCGVLRLPFVGEPLASLVTRVPGETDGSHGGIDACGFDAAGNVVISGWAWLPRQNRPADRVVIGSENVATGAFKPIIVVGTGERRPDLRDHFQQPKMMRAGFARTLNSANLAADPITISAWAIDLRKQRAYPLGGHHALKR